MSTKLLWLAFALIVATSGFGQGYTISTIAGAGWNIPGAVANLSNVQSVAVDASGNIYLSLATYSVVLRLDTSGQLSLVAGNGTPGFSGDGGPATLAQLSNPAALAVDLSGNVYIVDGTNNRVRMVTNGTISTVAGGGTQSPGNNGPATSVLFNFTNGSGVGLAVDSSANLYVRDSNSIRKVSSGIITTAAGGGGTLGDNIPASTAAMSAFSIAIDAAGDIYFADACYERIRKVSNGIVSTVAGNGQETFFACASGGSGPATGKATSVSLDSPQGIALDSAGNVYFTEGGSGPFRVRKVSNGNISTVAGGSLGPPFGDAVADNVPATTEELARLYSLAANSAGDLYFPDAYWVPGTRGTEAGVELGRLRKVSNGVITTLAGSPSDGGPPLAAQLNLPAGVAVDAAGNLDIADLSNGVIRQVSNGFITTIAGSRTQADNCSCESGPALNANISMPQSISVDAAGDLFIAAGQALEVSQGTVSELVAPASLNGFVTTSAVDASGNLYLADWRSNQIQELSNGVLTTIAGNGTAGFSGDNGPATAALVSGPSGITVDRAGNIYFTDTGNQRVRKISNGVITTVVGNGSTGFSGDNGPATGAQLSLLLPWTCCYAFNFAPQLPAGLVVDASGDLFIVDAGNQRVREVSKGIITTVAGTGTPGFSGDNGPATSAQFNSPSGITIDSQGRIYVADSGNGRVRVLSSGCAYTVTPPSLVIPAQGGTFPISIQTTPDCSWTMTGLPSWITLPLPGSVNGPGMISIVVAANTGTSRVANLMVGGQSITITETASATPGCIYTVSPSAVQIPPAGGSFTVTVQTGASCSWQLSGLFVWISPTTPPVGTGNGSVGLAVAPNSGPSLLDQVMVAGQSTTVTQGPGPMFAPGISSVMTAEGESPTIAPNTWVEIKGPFLGLPGDTRIWQNSDFVNSQLPTALDNISVTMNGESAYVYFISMNQINVLTPPDLAPGPVQVIVNVSGTSSAAFTSAAQADSPSLFAFNGGHYVAAVHANGSLVGPTSLYPGSTSPAQPGETILIYANGFGAIFPAVVKGSESQAGSLPTLPQVAIGGTAATVKFAGLVSPGEYQFNVVVPSSAPNGDLAISVTYQGATAQIGTLITVQH